MNIVAVIPARGGSKGVPYKNIKDLAGKPLVQYTIEAALNSESLNEIIVSTDDEQISSVVEQDGVEIDRRPKWLAQDNSLVIDTIRHVIRKKREVGRKFDLVVLLEPTSPLRTSEDIDNAIKALLEKSADTLATFSETEVPPTRIWKISEKKPKPFIDGADPFLPRQQHEKGYMLNGMVYVMKVDTLKVYDDTDSLLFGKTAAYIIPKERTIDIDTERDFLIAEQLLKKLK